jgi:hypothetical protein
MTLGPVGVTAQPPRTASDAPIEANKTSLEAFMAF